MANRALFKANTNCARHVYTLRLPTRVVSVRLIKIRKFKFESARRHLIIRTIPAVTTVGEFQKYIEPSDV